MWDPGQYARYADERSRPFVDLLARVGAEHPGVVVDAGCGPGTLTATLARRWPEARVTGFDSSPAMIEQARADADGHVRFVEGDVLAWEPDGPVDVLVSNAVLQWVPGHEAVLGRWAGFLAPGGWLAFQVPGNQGAPSHEAIRRVAARPPWRDLLPGGAVERLRVAEPARYLEVLTDAGLAAEVWETTYLHVLTGERPVLEWVKGTALRPILEALPDDAARDRFQAELALELAAAYPAGRHGTLFPFRRIFAVGHRTV